MFSRRIHDEHAYRSVRVCRIGRYRPGCAIAKRSNYLFLYRCCLARPTSLFSAISWNGSTLSFTIKAGTGATNLQATSVSSAGSLINIVRGTTNVKLYLTDY